jgi:hypothetical protein
MLQAFVKAYWLIDAKMPLFSRSRAQVYFLLTSANTPKIFFVVVEGGFKFCLQKNMYMCGYGCVYERTCSKFVPS